MQNPSSAHAQFFTSLKHLEKRLKLENNEAAGPSTLAQPPPPPPPPPPVEPQEVINSTQLTDSLGTPIYIYNQSVAADSNSSFVPESEAPQQFHLRSPDSPPPTTTNHEAEALESVGQPERPDLDGDIELLMQLLRLSDAQMVRQIAGTNDEGCDDELYEKIVGVKGPKNVKESERLERWIKHFMNGEKNEPFRLAHLLLGRAAFMHSDDGFEGIVYPSTIDEFLENEPPSH